MLKVAIAEDDFASLNSGRVFIKNKGCKSNRKSIERERNDGTTTKGRNRFASIR